MNIFLVVNNRVAIYAETILIEPFKTIWETNEPDMALRKFTYIEFMCSMKKSNPYIDYNEDVRGMKILQQSFPNESDEQINIIINDELVIQGMEVYKRFQREASPSLEFYEAALAAARKMSNFFMTVNISEKNPRSGMPVYKPSDITRALKDTNDVLKTLAGLREKVTMELYEDSKGKAGREINYFEISSTERGN